MSARPIGGGLAALTGEQARVLASWSGSLLVLGAPGTGKTTLVGWAAVQRLREGGAPPLVLASSRVAASRLRNAITTELGDGTWRPTVTTVHALARSLWQRFSGREQVRLLSAPEQEFRVRELLAGAGGGRWPQELAYAWGTRGFAAQVRAAIARARQWGLEPDDLVAWGRSSGRGVWAGLGDFFAEYLDVLDAEGVLDYAELVHRARVLLDQPEVADVVGAEIGAVLVDDFAELDPSQLALIAALAPGAPLLAVADPDSVSAGFRGADPRAVREFVARFGTPGRPASVEQLRQVYRHGAAICQALVEVRQRLPRPVSEPLPSPQASGPDGDVLVLTCTDAAEQAQTVVTELQRAHAIDGLAYSQMAVLTRAGRAQAAPITQALVAAGIPVSTAAEEIALAQAPAVRALLLAVTVAVAGQARPDEAIRLLTGPMGGFDAVSLRALVRQWQAAGHADEAHLPLADQAAQALNQPEWIGPNADGEAAKLAKVVGLLAQARGLLEASAPVDQLLWRLWQGTDWPQRLAAESGAQAAAAARADADLDALCALFDTAAEADRRGGLAGVRAFLAEIGGQQIPADRQRESRLGGGGVEVMTAHRARGREWEVVIVAGVQEGSWPLGRRISTVLDAAEIGADGLQGPAPARELLAAERRLFHLACSRARRRLIVTATAGTEGESDTPSRFLAELGVAAQRPARPARPVSLASLVADLRRASIDPSASVALRAAAAGELARLADAVDDRGRPLVAAARPEHWWGVRPVSSLPTGETPSVRLSPSQVSAALQCPRSYFLDRQAGGEGRARLSTSLGSLIHRLIQLSVEEQWSAQEVAEQLDQAWQRLPFEAAWFSASERAEVEQALGRFQTWRSSRPAELIAVEAPFTLELETDGIPVTLSGKVDWLERAEAGLRVIDFKTSRYAPTAQDVAGMDQLGIYQLAVASGAFDAAATQEAVDVRPAGAAAVYLRLPAKPEDLPREFGQESLDVRPHLSEDPAELAHPTWVHHRIAAAAAVVADGRFPATPGPHCDRCVFVASCPTQPRGQQVVR
ncbi:MAG: ATP-dependent helicase [Propionibacteriales bacterium]|nr:ATP-dependent helicase [Propionibacteriales bacterium]